MYANTFWYIFIKNVDTVKINYILICYTLLISIRYMCVCIYVYVYVCMYFCLLKNKK